jgi:hypothetical protein
VFEVLAPIEMRDAHAWGLEHVPPHEPRVLRAAMKTPRPVLDLAGQVFGRLTARARAGTEANGCARWLCDCVCGGTVRTRAADLLGGVTSSCGCLACERAAARLRHRGRVRRNLWSRPSWLRQREIERVRPLATDGRRPIIGAIRMLDPALPAWSSRSQQGFRRGSQQ